MSHNKARSPNGRRKRQRGAAAVLAAGLIAGGVLASTSGAFAAGNKTTPVVGNKANSPAVPNAAFAKSPKPVRGDEQSIAAALTSTLKTKAFAPRRPARCLDAAVASVSQSPVIITASVGHAFAARRACPTS